MKGNLSVVLPQLLLTAILSGSAPAATVRFDARTLFERAVTQNISLTKDGSTLQLASGDVYEDDGPASGWSYKPNEETLSPTVWIRKQLVIPDPRASSAVLMVGPGGGKLKVSINGQPQTLEDPRPTGFGQWQAYTFNPAALKPGVNEILMSGAGQVWIARSDDSYVEFPHRSARSADGGSTWNVDQLGPQGDISGEYYVRVYLEHYQTTGAILLPVMDVANLAGNPLAPPLVTTGPVRVSLRTDAANQHDCSIRVRSGTTFVPREGTWSEWVTLDSGHRLKTPRGRFLQVQVTLNTSDPTETPGLQDITLQTEPTLAMDWTKAVKIVDAHNEEIIRTSIPFQYEPYNEPRLKQLRVQYHLDDVVHGAKTEFEMITRLALWAAKQWKYGEWHLDEYYPEWNALEILKKDAKGKTIGGFCEQFDLVFLQACESFGLPGRGISISHGSLPLPKVGGHEPTEIWSNQFKKWVYVDGTSAWYSVDAATGVPLSLWEVRRRQIRTFRDEPVEPTRIIEIEKGVQMWTWRSLKEDLGFGELRLIPRSNFLEQKAPLPLNQGFQRAWFWDGHYVWNDSDAPAELLHAKRVTQHNNFEWTLNQAHYTLEPSAKPGEFLVHLDTETPGFETFFAQIDNAEQHPVNAVFPWKLHAGRNHLKVWPRNNAGRDGIASWLDLEVPTL